MTEAGSFRNEVGTLPPLWRSVLIVVVFLLVWPPICGSAGWWMKFDFGAPLLGWVATIAIYSYAVCGLPALLAGIIHAVAAVRFRYYAIPVPLLATICAFILTMAMTLGIHEKPMDYLAKVPIESHVMFLIASLIASLVCWRLTRRFARAA